MKAMLWKELRENLKWGVLAFLAMIMAEFYALSSAHGSYSEDFQNLTLLSSAFLLVSAFGCSVVGVALALVQILPELRRDQWAVLLHRPISRDTIFFGKAGAGLLLYFGATLLAFLASVAYVATPGQFAAPLVPGMLIPGLSDLFLGMAFYAATLLICLDRGPWWTRRAAVGLSLLPLLMLHLSVGMPFLLPILASVIYLIAARDALSSNGGMQERTWAGRISLVIVMLAGAETALLMLIYGLWFLPQDQARISIPYVSFAVSAEGHVYIERMNGDGESVVTNVDGTALPADKFKEMQGLTEMEYLCWGLHRDDAYRQAYITRQPRNLYNYVGETQGDYMSKEIWYKLIEQRYFVGYDKLSRRLIGICDRDGFKPPTATPNPFPSRIEDTILNFREPHLYWVGTQLFGFDFPERTMTTFDLGGERIYGAVNVTGDRTSEKPDFVVVAAQNRLHVFNSDGKAISAFPYPRDPDVWTSLSITTDEKAQHLYLQSSGATSLWFVPAHEKKPSVPAYLDELDLQGQVVHSYSRPPDPDITLPEGWIGHVTTLLSPFLPAALGKIQTGMEPNAPATPASALGAFSFPQPDFNPRGSALITIFGLDLLLALVVLGCALRIGFSKARALGWAVLTVCFGLPALFVFRFGSDWPVRVRCPQCQAPRPLKTEKCPSCQEAWPLPRATGIEVFQA